LSGILLALYFITAPPADLLTLQPQSSPITAQANEKYLRWFSRGESTIRHNHLTLATLTAPATLIADFQDEGFLRITIEPNTADNALFYAPEVSQIFVNTRKLNCRIEGTYRRAFYPILNNREPCER